MSKSPSGLAFNGVLIREMTDLQLYAAKIELGKLLVVAVQNMSVAQDSYRNIHAMVNVLQFEHERRENPVIFTGEKH